MRNVSRWIAVGLVGIAPGYGACSRRPVGEFADTSTLKNDSATSASPTSTIATPVVPGPTENPLPTEAPNAPFTFVYDGTTLSVSRAHVDVNRAGSSPRITAMHILFVTPPKLGDMVLESGVTLWMTLRFDEDEPELKVSGRRPVSVQLGGQGNWGNYKGRGLPRPAWNALGRGWVSFRKESYKAGATIEASSVVVVGMSSNRLGSGSGHLSVDVQ